MIATWRASIRHCFARSIANLLGWHSHWRWRDAHRRGLVWSTHRWSKRHPGNDHVDRIVNLRVPVRRRLELAKEGQWWRVDREWDLDLGRVGAAHVVAGSDAQLVVELDNLAICCWLHHLTVVSVLENLLFRETDSFTTVSQEPRNRDCFEKTQGFRAALICIKFLQVLKHHMQ